MSRKTRITRLTAPLSSRTTEPETCTCTSCPFWVRHSMSIAPGTAQVLATQRARERDLVCGNRRAVEVARLQHLCPLKDGERCPLG